jgi:phosphoribosylformimino-5-aminoimidazole carboxamide ribotide isomerase
MMAFAADVVPPAPGIFPAVDLRGGRCVRLLRGERGVQFDYGGDPVAAAARWAAAGAEWIHAIDLGGALGEADNLEAIAAIARAVRIPVQAGGGLRDEERIAKLLDAGVFRVILGTRALRDPPFLERVVARHGTARVVLAMDVAGDRIRLKGWEEESPLDLEGGLDLALRSGVKHVLITAIERDGTLAGPAVDLIRRALDAGAPAVVAAGGIGTIDDVRSLLDLRHPRLEGVVVGRALYEERVQLEAAVALSKEYRKP